MGGANGNNSNMGCRDSCRFVDVVYGRNTSTGEGPDSGKYANGRGINKVNEKDGVESKGVGQYTYDKGTHSKLTKNFERKRDVLRLKILRLIA
ncbi:hypothetical protein Tco_0460423, partial [Tanacetum coccineum]